MDAFVDICQAGCDGTNVIGSQTAPQSAGLTYYSFEEVLVDLVYDGNVQEYSVLCTHELISYPAVSVSADWFGPGNFSKPDTCSCEYADEVLGDYEDKVIQGSLPDMVESLEDYLLYLGMNPIDVETLICECDGINPERNLPGATWSATQIQELGEIDFLYVPDDWQCSKCISCTVTDVLISEIESDYNLGVDGFSVFDHLQLLQQRIQLQYGVQASQGSLEEHLFQCNLIAIPQVVDTCFDWGICLYELNIITQKDFLPLIEAIGAEPLPVTRRIWDLEEDPFQFWSEFQLADIITQGGTIPGPYFIQYEFVDGGNGEVDLVISFWGGYPGEDGVLICSFTIDFDDNQFMEIFGFHYDYDPRKSQKESLNEILNLLNYKEGVVEWIQIMKLAWHGGCLEYPIGKGVIMVNNEEMYFTVESDCFFDYCFPDYSEPTGLGTHDLCDEDLSVSWSWDPCYDILYSQAVHDAYWEYENYRTGKAKEFRGNYISSCFEGVNESLTREFDYDLHHFTLYYYDQSANLIKTVPPKGVAFLNTAQVLNVQSNRISGSGSVVPPHSLNTNYEYNSLNQLILQITPDGGATMFWYDQMGRIVVSQSAQQQNDSKYTYNVYDAHGRITEVGEISSTSFNPADTKDPFKLQAWLAGVTRKDVTKTRYDGDDNAVRDLVGLGHENLRGRVASSSKFEVFQYGDRALDGTHSTHYSYDIHGNVDTLVQHQTGKAGTGTGFYNRKEDFKQIIYDYDLITGNVKEVAYQKGQADAFYHRYSYDDDNRILAVKTSRNGILWEQDASYEYYPHGPLARVEIGEDNVQAMDYAYTIQGWLKGVNSWKADDTLDLGQDGILNSSVARDAFAFALFYNDRQDYKSIGAGSNGFEPSGLVSKQIPELYNGNIAAMSTSEGLP